MLMEQAALCSCVSGTGTAGVAADRMTIQADGNVGIGTTSPNHSLSFGSPANGTKSLALWENGTAFYGLGNDTNRLAFYASNSAGTAERMVIDSDGNVGIGTTSPSVPLHVNSAQTTLASSLRLMRPSDFNVSNGQGEGIEFHVGIGAVGI